MIQITTHYLDPSCETLDEYAYLLYKVWGKECACQFPLVTLEREVPEYTYDFEIWKIIFDYGRSEDTPP